MAKFPKITESIESNFIEAFETSARDNAAASDGLLVAYRADFATFPYQSISVQLDRRGVASTPIDPEKVFDTISFLEPSCINLEQIILSDGAKSGYDAMSANLQAGQSTAAGTGHLTIEDIAYFGAGVAARLRKDGVRHKSGIVLSKAASDYMGINLERFITDKLPFEVIAKFITDLGLTIHNIGGVRSVPVRDFVALGFDHQYLVIPNSGSFANLRQSEIDVTTWHNSRVKHDINTDTGNKGIRRNRPPLALFFVASGQKIKQLDINEYWQGMRIEGNYQTIPEHLPTSADQVGVVGKIPDGITDYTSTLVTFAATMRMHDASGVDVRIDPVPVNVHDKKGIYDYAGRLVRLVTEVDQIPAVYDTKGNLPLLKAA